MVTGFSSHFLFWIECMQLNTSGPVNTSSDHIHQLELRVSRVLAGGNHIQLAQMRTHIWDVTYCQMLLADRTGKRIHSHKVSSGSQWERWKHLQLCNNHGELWKTYLFPLYPIHYLPLAAMYTHVFYWAQLSFSFLVPVMFSTAQHCGSSSWSRVN